MFTRSVAIGRRRALLPSEEAHVQTKRWPVLMHLSLLIFLCLIALITVVITAARAAQAPQLPDILQVYLPGNLLPSNAKCYWPGNEQMPRCSVQFGNDEVFFSFDALTGMITRTIVPTLEYTIGDLINAWGTPTGISQVSTVTRVYWGTRSALLYTSLRPDSQIEVILYDLKARAKSPWRGFRRRNH